MKMLVTVVSGLLVGLSLASSNFSPIRELKNILANKRRIFISLGVAVTGYLFIFSGLIIGLVEWALQSDAQGFVVWSSVMNVAIGLAVAGVASIVVARLLIPLPVVEQESVIAELNRQFNLSEHLEGLVKHFSESRQTAKTEEQAPVQEEKFSEPAREPRFADVNLARGSVHH